MRPADWRWLRSQRVDRRVTKKAVPPMIRFLQQDSIITKAIFVVFITVVVVFMVITLVPGIFDTAGGSADTYATVRQPGFLARYTGDTSVVKAAEVQATAQRLLKRQGYPDMFLQFLLPQAGKALVERAILLQQAEHMGLSVTDDDLRRELHNGQFGEVIFPNGQYIGDDQYTNLIQSNFGVTREQFESDIKKQMEITRLEALVTGGVVVPDAEVRDAVLKQGTKVKFDYAILTADDLRKQINPSDAELQTFFKTNAARYANAIPEARKIRFIAFDYGQIPGGVPQVSDAEIAQYYATHQDQYKVDDRVRVRHILIKSTTPADDAAAKKKAQDLLQQIRSGADFAKLARENSDDPGSKQAGGELGFLQHGTTVPEFDKMAFSLNPGQVSDLVKTRFGYHIIQTEEKQTAHVKPLEEVKLQIVPQLQRQKQTAAAQAYAQQLASESQKNGMDKAAEAHGLKVVTTDYVPQGSVVPSLADSAALMTQAFSVKANTAPQTVATGEGMAVFQVADVHTAHAPTFEEYKSHIADDYAQQQVPQLLDKKTRELADKAHAYNDVKKAAKEVGATVKTSDLVGQQAQVLEIGALTGPAAQVFTLSPGQISGPVNTGRAGVVMQVLDKQVPSDVEVAKTMDQARDAMVGQRRDDVFSVYVSNLEKQYTKDKLISYGKKAQAAPQPVVPQS